MMRWRCAAPKSAPILSFYYNNLPDYFIAFDVFDAQEQKFFSVRRRNELLQATDLAIVPQIGHGQFNTDNLLAMEFISNYGDEMCEGIHLRCDSEDWLRYRAKIIRPDFSQSIETHWRKNLWRQIVCVIRALSALNESPFFELFYRITGLGFCPILCRIWASGVCCMRILF